MNRYGLRKAHVILLLLTLHCGTGRSAEPVSFYLRPDMRRLMDAVTLHVSFDADSLTPDMAEGPQFKPQVFSSANKERPQPQFADGLVGRALVLGTGGAVYPRTGNVLFGHRGAMALWVQPQQWQRPRDGNCVFAMTSTARFYLERQGPDVDDAGQVRRQESVLYITFLPQGRGSTLADGTPWQNGQWYLIVANWSWPTMELSVNGQPFSVRSLPETPPEKDFGDLVVGDRGGQERGLLDELFAFRRPLTLDEVQLLWQLRPQSK
jgi:hypothetical protein